jgi:hypothetical protein
MVDKHQLSAIFINIYNRIINNNRANVKYEAYKGHLLDRNMLELLKEY